MTKRIVFIFTLISVLVQSLQASISVFENRLNCHFNESLCQWTTQNVVTFNVPGTSKSLNGPQFRVQEDVGFLELRRSVPSQVLSMVSPQLPSILLDDSSMCLHLELYAVSGHFHDQIHVACQYRSDVNSNASSEPKAEKPDFGGFHDSYSYYETESINSDTDAEWHVIKVIHDLSFDGWTTHSIPLKKSMRRLRLSANMSSLHLARSRLTDGPCHTPDVCSFEPGNECDALFEPAYSAEAAKRVQAIDGVAYQFPNCDASTASSYGHYLRLLPRQTNETLRIFEAPLSRRLPGRPMYLDMQVYWPSEQGIQVSASIEIFEHDDSVSRITFWTSEQLSPINDWQRIMSLIPMDYAFQTAQIVFNVRTTLDHNVFRVALDDIRVHAFPDDGSIASCSFLENLCGYSNSVESNLAFLVGPGRTNDPDRISQFRLIRSFDPADRYLYLDCTWLPQFLSSVKAILRSPFMTPSTNSGCLRITYNLHLNQQASTKVILRLAMSGSLSQELVILDENNDSDSWTVIEQTIVPQLQPFAIEIEFQMAKIDHYVPFFAIRSIDFDSSNACDANENQSINQLDKLVEESFVKWKSVTDCEFDARVCEGWTGNDAGWKPIEDAAFAKSKLLPLVDPGGGSCFDYNPKIIIMKHSYLSYTVQKGEFGVLRSPKYESPGSNYQACLHFSYFLTSNCLDCSLKLKWNGTSVSEAPLLVATVGQPHSGYHTGWSKLRRSVVMRDQSELVITARLTYGAMAIRDLYFKAGNCPPYMNTEFIMCTFEDDSCQFSPEYLDRPRFRVTEASFFGIDDHSLNQPKGNVLALSGAMMSSKESGWEHVSQVTFFVHDGSYLLSFWINGFADFVLEVLVEDHDPDNDQPIWTHHHPVPDPTWQVHYMNILVRDHKSIIFRVTLNEFESNQYFALDDVRFDRNRQVSHQCDLDSQCYWQPNLASLSFLDQSNQAQLGGLRLELFQVESADTQGLNGFIPVDHTLGEPDGLFWYLSSSQPAELQSPSFTIPTVLKKSSVFRQPMCLRFWYFWPPRNNYIPSDQDVRVRILVGSGNKSDLHQQAELLSRDLNRSGWQSVSVTLDFEHVEHIEQVNVYIRVEPLALDGDRHVYFALDDLLLSAGSCLDSDKMVLCQPNDPYSQRVLVTHLCDFRQDCENGFDELNCGDCEFDKDFCGYENTKLRSYKFNWKIADLLPSQCSVPTNRKSFALLEGASQAVRAEDQFAGLKSKLLHNSHVTCEMVLEYVSTCGDFHVQVEPTDDLEFSLLHEQNHIVNFTEITLQLGKLAGSFRLQLASRHKPSTECVTAIGSVRMQNCGLPNAGAEFPCPGDQFTCDNNVCIDHNRLCDHAQDCGDNSDESNCLYDRLSCTFESGLCEWLSMPAYNRWENQFQLTAGFTIPSYGPTRDHTNNRKQGLFLLLEYDEIDKEPTIALIQGGPLHVHAGCQLRMYVMCRDCQIDFSIFWFEVDKNKPITHQTKSIQSRWNWQRIEFDLSTGNSSSWSPSLASLVIQTEATAQSQFVAIDDISFTSSCYSSKIGSVDCSFGQTIPKLCNWKVNQSNSLMSITDASSLMFAYDSEHDSNVSNTTKVHYERRTASIMSPITWAKPRTLMFLRLQYRMSDIHSRRLAIYNVFSSEPQLIWQDTQTSNQHWQQACVPFNVPLTGGIQLSIEAQMHHPFSSIAVMSFSIDNSPCDQSRCTFDSRLHCDSTVFDLSLWDLRSLSFHQVENAPDHTIGSADGGFAMIVSAPQIRQRPMRLKSSVNAPTQCLSFWFAVFPSNQNNNETSYDSAKIQIRPESNLTETLYTADIISVQEWYQALTTVTKPSKARNLLIQLQGEMVGTADSFVLTVDDLSFLPGPCTVVNCDFDMLHSCDWHAQPMDQEDTYTGWAVMFLHDLQLVGEKQIPSADASMKSADGGVMYTAFSRQLPSRHSVLVSSVFNIAVEGQCLTFMYWASPAANLSLEVWTINRQMAKLQTTIRPKAGINDWTVVMVHVNKLEGGEGQIIKFIAKNHEFNTLHNDSLNPLHNMMMIDLILLSPVGCSDNKDEVYPPITTSDSFVTETFMTTITTPNGPVDTLNVTGLDNLEDATVSTSKQNKTNESSNEWFKSSAIYIIATCLSVIAVTIIIKFSINGKWMNKWLPISIRLPFFRKNCDESEVLYANNQPESIELR